MLKNLDVAPIVVVTGYRAEELESHLSLDDVRFVRNDRYQETQMFDSVKMGIEAVREDCDRVMLMPIDAPGIMPETIRQVMMIDTAMVRTIYHGEPGHPILIKKEFLDPICAYEGNRGLRGAMEESGVPLTNLEVEDRCVCWDVDTRKEYEELLEWKFRQGKGHPIQPVVQVRLKGTQMFFGPGCAELLEMIDQTGSIQEACARMELSYSKGSKMVKTMEQQLGYKIAERRAGGTGGGGTSLTDRGRKLLENYGALTKEIEQNAEEIFQKYFEN
jgi:molybdate transport repressor ModE-like protein